MKTQEDIFYKDYKLPNLDSIVSRNCNNLESYAFPLSVDKINQAKSNNIVAKPYSL